MHCIHIWIPHKIRCILSIHTRGKSKSLHVLKQKFSGAFGAKCGLDLLNILNLLGGWEMGGGWVLVSGPGVRIPPMVLANLHSQLGSKLCTNNVYQCPPSALWPSQVPRR